MKRQYARDLTPGERVDDLFVVVEARLSQSRNGPYWTLTLADRTGRLEARLWSPAAQRYPAIPTGRAARVTGMAETYRDKLQLVLDAVECFEADPTPAELAELVPAAPMPPEELMESLEELLRRELTHKPWRDLTRRVLADPEIREKLLVAPGAKAIHHAYLGGLLEHTLSVCRICLRLADLYPGLDREALLVAAAFHDLGKAFELSAGLAADFTDEGRLLGHIALGLSRMEGHMARVKALEPELALHVKHMILSHHGELEFGSPKRPKTPEAFVLHFADQIDAKLNTAEGALDEAGEGARWTAYLRSLERPLYRASQTPRPAGEDKRGGDKVPGQCLLPLKA